MELIVVRRPGQPDGYMTPADVARPCGYCGRNAHLLTSERIMCDCPTRTGLPPELRPGEVVLGEVDVDRSLADGVLATRPRVNLNEKGY